MTLMSAIKSSLRARRRQYDIRDYIAEEKRTADELAQLYESELAARAEAQAANRLKDDFLATVSHELRTPLNAMLGWVTLLKTGNLDAEAAERALTVIERNARSQAQIIEDLLDVSRIITGRLTLNVQSFNIVQLIETVIQSIQPSVAAKNITVTPHISEDVGLISADSARIQQILWNLLTNAVKFTPNDGQIEISARREDAMLSISVKDTGKGIAPAFLPFVFDRFRQAESSTTRRFGGLGLGLAIVRHLVELHGGTVSVESRGEGQGAIFTIKIPLVQPQQPLIEAETNGAARPENSGTSAPVSLNGLNILIVDDEADAREMVKMFLENSGANVTAANSVTEALEKLQRKVPDLIISDIGMPDINGYQFIEKVRSLPPENGGTVPAVALTAYSRGEDVKRALRAGYQKHIAKPIEMNKLAVTVADAVGRV
jgi:signal transduction histidine kinase/CheY-like chemotaxis protein